MGKLFWHYIGEKLYLGFKYWVEKFACLMKSKFELLKKIDVSIWEILTHPNEQRKEKHRQEINQEAPAVLNNLHDKVENHWRSFEDYKIKR